MAETISSNRAPLDFHVVLIVKHYDKTCLDSDVLLESAIYKEDTGIVLSQKDTSSESKVFFEVAVSHV